MLCQNIIAITRNHYEFPTPPSPHPLKLILKKTDISSQLALGQIIHKKSALWQLILIYQRGQILNNAVLRLWFWLHELAHNLILLGIANIYIKMRFATTIVHVTVFACTIAITRWSLVGWSKPTRFLKNINFLSTKYILNYLKQNNGTNYSVLW